MLQVKCLILNFFFLVFRILFDLSLNVSHKQYGFSETPPEKSFKFVQSKSGGTVVLNLGFVLLPAEVDSILDKQSYKKMR